MPQGKQQYFSNAGALLVGGKVYTYSAGTTTPLATYSDAAGTTPNTNPVILDSRGEASVFFGGSSYKLVLKDSADATIWTQDNLTADLAALAASGGSALVGYLPAGTGAVASTVQAKLRERVSVLDFGAVGDGVTDDTAAIQAALTASLRVFIPDGTYKITSTLVLRANQHVIGASTLGTTLQANTDITVMSATNISQVVLEDFQIFGIGKATSTKYGLQWINTPYCVFNRIYIIGFAKGIYFKAGGIGAQSSFSNSINNCVVHYNTVNIDAELNTNNLNLFSTRFGSASIGLRFFDSNTLCIIGSDCEGCTTAAVQIDAAVAATDVGVTISGTHFENSTSTGGDIVLGGTNRISGVSITGNLFYGGAGNATPVSMLYVSGVVFSGNTVFGLYTSKNPTFGTTTNVAISGNHPIASIPNLINGGITFPATQVASTDPNTLDDYEEGTWTPAWTNLTVVGTPTYTGRYIKIGRLVTCHVQVASTTTTASTAGSTTITAASLPYSMDANPANYAGVTAANAGTIASYGVGIVNAATSTVYPPTWSATGTVGLSFSYISAQ